jgi:hypothetical protein
MFRVSPDAARIREKGLSVKLVVIAVSLVAALMLPCAALAAGPALPGKYTVKVASPAQLKGTWTLTFTKATYTVARNGTVVVRGSYTVAGAKVTLSKESGPLACADAGKYSWKRVGKQLTLKKLSETARCTGRSLILAHAFKIA